MSELTLVRDWHTIKKNKSTCTPTRIVYLAVRGRSAAGPTPDGEDWLTIDNWHARYVAYKKGIPTGESSTHWMGVLSFWEWLKSLLPRRGITWVVCRGAATSFALIRLWDEIDSERYHLDSAIIDSLPWIVELNDEGRKVRLVDLENWLPTAPDYDQSIEHEVNELQQHSEEVLKWWQSNDLGTFRPTVGGCAWNLWRHRFMDVKVELHGVGEVLDLERAAYRGGRVECFRQGVVQGPIYVCDIQSAYPYAMASQKYPRCLAGTAPEMKVADLWGLVKQYAVAAEVILETPDPYPHRLEDGRVVYPVGRYSTALCGIELQRAAMLGHVTRVGRVAWYETAQLFYLWGYWYKEQLQWAEKTRCKAWVKWIKALGRSLYGRWGMQSQDWVEWPEYHREKGWGPFWAANQGEQVATHGRRLSGFAQRHLRKGETWDSWPIIAAMTTAYVREMMREALAAVGPRHCYYLDTDELHVDGDGLDALEAGYFIGNSLGMLRLKRKVNWAEYHGPRDYVNDDLRVWSGVGGSKLVVTADGTLQTTISEGCRSILARDLDGVVRTMTIPVSHKRWVPPGGVDEGGWTLPLKL